MRLKNILLTLIILANILCLKNYCFAQVVREEKEEKTFDIRRLTKKPPAFRFSGVAGLFGGYDSNARLSRESKGDYFEEFLFSGNVIKPWIAKTKFIFDYDLDVLNYNEATDVSNVLNHGRFTVDKKFDWVNTGLGYDLSIYGYFHNDDGSFLFNKYFFYVGKELMRNLYNQVLFQYGNKYYFDRKALSDAGTGAYQDKERREERQSVEYMIAAKPSRKLTLKFLARFSINDSNDRYQDFYDYKSIEFSPSVNYQITRKWGVLANFIYLKKKYKTRLVTSENYREKEPIYATNLMFKYKMDKNNVLSFLYTYRNDTANDSLDKYTENSFSLGWQYNF